MSAANEKVGGGTYDVVAITACPTGIAHTFMAAKGLEDQAAKMGVSIKVETQGSGGAKNVLTAADIAGAKGVIIAADKNVELDRFDGKSVYSCAVTRGINDAEELINIALAGNAPIHHVSGGAAVQAAAEGESEGLGRRVYKDLMNGVSHMLPFVVGGGILMALSFLLDQAGLGTSAYGHSTPVAAFFNLAGNQAFNFMLPILAGYIAMSIADRPGLARALWVAGLQSRALRWAISPRQWMPMPRLSLSLLAFWARCWSVLPPALSSMRSRRLQACYPSRSTVSSPCSSTPCWAFSLRVSL